MMAQDPQSLEQMLTSLERPLRVRPTSHDTGTPTPGTCATSAVSSSEVVAHARLPMKIRHGSAGASGSATGAVKARCFLGFDDLAGAPRSSRTKMRRPPAR